MSSFVIFWLIPPLPLGWWRHLWTAPYMYLYLYLKLHSHSSQSFPLLSLSKLFREENFPQKCWFEKTKMTGDIPSPHITFIWSRDVFLGCSQSDIVKDLLCWSESQVSWSALWSSVFEQCVGGREGQGHLQICLGTTGNNICAHLEMFTIFFFVLNYQKQLTSRLK